VVYEQRVQVTDPENGAVLLLRRIEVRLFQNRRDGERTIALLTNLSDEVSALQIAEIYRLRWTIEKHFQFLTQSLHCELPGLGQPRAALFGFAMALLAANALAVVRASIRSAHGVEAEAEVSGYYLADEIALAASRRPSTSNRR
jgi:IS4 transposase